MIATTPGSGELSSIVQLADAGLLEPVTDSAKELVPAGGEDLFIVDDKIYGVPQGLTVSGLVVAGAGLAPLGLDPFPATTEELIAKCGELSKMGLSLIVLAGGAAPNTGLAAMTIAAGAVYADDPDWNAKRLDGDVTFADSEGWQTTLETILELEENGCFQEGSAGAGFDVITNNLQQQKSVGAFIPGNTVGELVSAANLRPSVGSWLTNKMTDWALDKPHGFYLSSFRCVTAFVARRVADYAGPYPYIDGLVLQVTQRIGSIEVGHEVRRAGRSTYTLRRLIRLWLSAWINFSVLPLRAATLVGLLLAAAGLVALVTVAVLWFRNVGPSYGFGWIMAALLVFSGTQLVMLGLIGEYLGRMFLTVNQRPQSVVREVVSSRSHP